MPRLFWGRASCGSSLFSGFRTLVLDVYKPSERQTCISNTPRPTLEDLPMMGSTTGTTTGTTILVGDIGGTKTAIAAFELCGTALRLLADSTFASAEHASLDVILRVFLDDNPGLRIDSTCFGVAGAVAHASTAQSAR